MTNSIVKNKSNAITKHIFKILPYSAYFNLKINVGTTHIQLMNIKSRGITSNDIIEFSTSLWQTKSIDQVKVTSTIGFTILDFAKVLIFYLLLVTWSIDFVCHNDVLNSIISLLVIPLDLMFISCICVVPTFILRLKYAEYGNILNICLVMALDLFLTILFVILIRLLIAESFLTTYSIISSNEWWENILNIARKWWLH